MLRSLSHYLDDAMRRSGAKRSVDAAVIVETAKPILLQLMPELRPTDLQVQFYREEALTIGVASSVVGQELRLREDVILDVLRDTFPGHVFARLRIVFEKPTEEY